MAGAPGAAADRAPVDVGQPQIEHDEVRVVAVHRLQGLRAGAHDVERVPGLVQLDLEQTGDSGVVLHNEDALSDGRHG